MTEQATPTGHRPRRSNANRQMVTATKVAAAAADHTRPTAVVDCPKCWTTITGPAAWSRPVARLDRASPATSQPSAGSARMVRPR